ncbi:Imidazole glycerol phosphate synthase subunit HisH [compost metagenome]
MIGIINYGSGNVGAIANIYKQLKVAHFVSSSVDELSAADRLILPGVGAFDATMKNLTESGLLAMLNEQVLEKGKNILGVCVGMQILADSSEEGERAGLGWIRGRVRKIDASKIITALKLPHMGWNSLASKVEHPLFENVKAESGFYFLHNYFFDAEIRNEILATVNYGSEIPCAVARENIFGVQFHPEKSHHNGLAVFRNFASI